MAETDPPRPAYRLRLVALPSGVPAAVRLRMVLKYALRVCRLRCVEAVQVEGETAAGPGGGEG